MDPQLKAFAKSAARNRQERYKVKFIYNRSIAGQSVTLEAAMSGIADKRKLQDGFLYEHHAVCRILRDQIAFRPLLGDTITFEDHPPLQVAEVLGHPLNPEWKLGLDADI